MDGGTAATTGTTDPAVTSVLIAGNAAVDLLHRAHLLRRLEGCSVQQFTDPAQALAWAADNDAALAIVDYMTPEFDSLEFARRFRACAGKSATPLLMVTANHVIELRHRALQAGAEDFLNKPLDGAEFFACVKITPDLRARHRQFALRAVLPAQAA